MFPVIGSIITTVVAPLMLLKIYLMHKEYKKNIAKLPKNIRELYLSNENH